MPKSLYWFLPLLLVCAWTSVALSDEISDQLKALASGNESEVEKALDYLSKQSVDPDKQSEVAKALNQLDKGGNHELAEPALLVWATSDNVPLIIRILESKKFDRGNLLDLAAKMKDDRFLLPLVNILKDTHDDGKKAEAVLAGWGKSASPIILQQINHPDDEAHSRLVRLWEQRKLDKDARTLQSVIDLGAKDKQTRQYAGEWLAQQKTISDSTRKQATEFALNALKDAKGTDALDLTEIIAKFGHESFRDDYVKMIESKDFHQWHAGLHGVILSGDVRCAKTLIERMKNEEFAGQVSKIMTRHGAKSETLALALLKQPIDAPRGLAHLSVCMILGEVGTKKSVSALNQLANKKTVSDNLRNAAKVSAAEISSRKGAR
ncbi:MAG: hypothetical protein U0894_08795 [Pirellulales bacterium]